MCDARTAGSDGDPFPALRGKPDQHVFDNLITRTPTGFRDHEEEVLQ